VINAAYSARDKCCMYYDAPKSGILGGVLIATKGILQDARLLKVTDVPAHLDDAATGGIGHEDDTH